MKLNAKQLAELIAAALAPVFATILGEGKASTTSTDDGDDGDDDAPTTKKRGRPAGSTKKDEGKTSGKTSGKKPPADEDDDDGLGDDGEDDDGDGLGLDDDAEEVTQEDVVNAFKALKSSHGIEKCREVLAKIGESNALNIPAKKYGDAMKEIQRAASKKK